jgi:hypothetical protein
LHPVRDGKDIKLSVDKLSSNYRIGNDRSVVFDRKFVAHLKKITHHTGLLSAVIELLPVISEAQSQYHRSAGDYGIDTGQRYAAVLQLIKNVNKYAQQENAPKSIAKRRKPKKEAV